MAKKFRNRYSVTAIVVAVIAVVISASVVMSGIAEAKGPRPFNGDAFGVFNADGQSGSGTINATHMGNGTVEFSDLVVVFDPSLASPDPDNSAILCFPVAGGDQTLTAANGDQLETVYSSGNFCADVSGMAATPPTPPIPVYGNFVTTVLDGTGRFDGASGEIFIDAVAGFTEEGMTFTSTFTDESWIQY